MNHLPNSPSDRPKGAVSSQPAAASGRPARSRSSSASNSHSSRGLDTGLFVVLLLIASVIFVNAVQDTFQLNRARAALGNQITQQGETLNEAQKVRAQLEAIAGDTAMLAEAGNQNAIQLRDFLAQQGVTIRPPAR